MARPRSDTRPGRLPAAFVSASLSALLGVADIGDGIRRAIAAEPRQIDIAHLPPKNPAHQPLYGLLRERRVLEKLRELLAPFRLPRRVLPKAEGCDGVANAY